MTSDEQLIRYCKQFEEAENLTRPAREKSELCRDYFDDKQHTEDEEKALRDRGQPVVTFNEIKPKVKTMLGLEKQTRKDPKAFPRNPDDEDAARAATDAIRYVCDDSRWDDKRSRAEREHRPLRPAVAVVHGHLCVAGADRVPHGRDVGAAEVGEVARADDQGTPGQVVGRGGDPTQRARSRTDTHGPSALIASMSECAVGSWRK